MTPAKVNLAPSTHVFSLSFPFSQRLPKYFSIRHRFNLKNRCVPVVFNYSNVKLLLVLQCGHPSNYGFAMFNTSLYK